MHVVTVVVLLLAALATLGLGFYVYVYLPQELDRQLQEALRAFSTAVELRFPSHRGLSARVVLLSKTVGIELGLSRRCLADLEMAASLRDIGLCAVPYGLVNERHPKAWTAEETQAYEKHGETSGLMLGQVPQLAHLAPIVSNHHHDFSNGGSDSQIPLEARILNAVTAYLWDERLQGDLLAREALRERTGTTFDPRVVEALLRVLPSQRAGVNSNQSYARL